MKHHPDCPWWYENLPQDCDCGLARERPEGSTLEPWTDERFAAWSAEVKAQQARNGA